MSGSSLADVIDRIAAVRASVPRERAALVAVSGIDGCGKGYVAARIVDGLTARGLRPAALNVDGWLRLPAERFDRANPAEHFYLHALRLDDMFAQLVLPLRDRRSIRVEMDFAEETATAYRRHVYDLCDVDVVVLEGIYLLKRAYRPLYDLSLWIECSFETALERAVARAQEGLPPDETILAYRTIYFPAQEIHFARDAPRDGASTVISNDPRLALGRT